MEDNKLKFKFKISRKDQEALFGVQPHIAEAASATIDVKEDGDELEEGEIREEEEEVPNEHKEIEALKKRSCPHCGREFSSGKALGGHLRVHTENPSKPKPNSSVPNPAQHQAAVHRCSMCHKRFSSKKGLFGHMRLHPERQYRGMQPPFHLTSRNPYRYSLMDPGLDSGSGRGQPAMDLLREMDGWKVKGKRGQKGWADALSPLSSSGFGFCDCADGGASSGFGHCADGGASSGFGHCADDEMVAVEVFCHFANNGIGDDGSCTKKHKTEEFDEDELYFLQHFFELTTNTNLNANAHLSNCPKKVIKSENSVAVDDDHITKRKIIEDNDGEQDEELGKKWKCSTCNKTFQTHQAFVGHGSSHNRDSGSESGHEELQYKCKICRQSFSSGQASGGHRRSHIVQSSSESSPEQIISHTGRKDTPALEFDLNLMAEDIGLVE